MKTILWFLFGYADLCIVGANPSQALNELTKRRIAFTVLLLQDEMTLKIRILQKDLEIAEFAIKKAMCDCELLEKKKFYDSTRGFWKSPVLLCVILLSVLAALIFPRHVWFYEIEGNITIPDAQIIRELKNCGVGFGTFGPSIKPQLVKNKMINRISKIKWMTIQQKGAKAVVVIREKDETDQILDRKTPQNVIASRACMITKMDVSEGTACCKIGDIVNRGQLLVSGYLQLDRKTMVSSAFAEIYGKTSRNFKVKLPSESTIMTLPKKEKTVCCILIGNRRLNPFSQTCFLQEGSYKTTELKKMVLPGGLSLPIALEITTFWNYDTDKREYTADELSKKLCNLAQEVVQQDMIAGVIEEKSFSVQRKNGQIVCNADFSCEEMVARMVNAQIFKDE